jgi:hypothetical protein
MDQMADNTAFGVKLPEMTDSFNSLLEPVYNHPSGPGRLQTYL